MKASVAAAVLLVGLLSGSGCAKTPVIARPPSEAPAAAQPYMVRVRLCDWWPVEQQRGWVPHLFYRNEHRPPLTPCGAIAELEHGSSLWVNSGWQSGILYTDRRECQRVLSGWFREPNARCIGVQIRSVHFDLPS
jgi:hypothetical protein